MREYLERIFPVLSAEKNETANERTWHLYDTINFVEFFVFLMLRTVLETVFNIVFGVVKFGIVLFLTYAFAFLIFYYFDRYMPEDKILSSTATMKQTSGMGSQKENHISTKSLIASYESKLNEIANEPQKSERYSGDEKRRSSPSTMKRNNGSASSKENNSSTKPSIASYESKLKENDNELVKSHETQQSNILDPHRYSKSLDSKLDENNSHRLYPTLVSHPSEWENTENISTLKIEKSPFPPRPRDDDSNLSMEQVVRVGSFRRPDVENGQQSIVGRALADLANIETKTYSTENKSENISVTKSDLKAIKSSNV